VRSGTGRRVVAAALALGALACAWAPSAQAQEETPSVTVAVLAFGVEPREIGDVPGMSPGLMSAGLSTVTSTQTFLDISAGNRIFTSLYDGEDPFLVSSENKVEDWDEIVERAEGAPGDIVPGLLGSTLEDAGIPTSADPLLITPALIAVDEQGNIERTKEFACIEARCPGLSVVPVVRDDLPAMVERLRGDDMLIAMERPPPPTRDTLAMGIAGRGFDGNLTSDTTRTPGFVLATDLAPTILERFGVGVPSEMSGRPIRSEGDVDVEALQDRGKRMTVVSGRRGPVIVRNLMIWFAVAALVALLSRGRLSAPAFGVLGLSFVYLPVMLLVGAAVQPVREVEQLIVGLGAPALAALTLFALRDWTALAVACGVSVAAYSLDVITGSTLTAQSLLGPNPGLGVRFFGIGNELESILAVTIPVGVGAALMSARQRFGLEISSRTAAIAFLGAGALFAAIFAAGRFGADVGAAIVFPAGAAMAALALPGALRRRKLAIGVIAAPVAGLMLLAVIDLVAGGDAHLSRSVFEAGGTEELGDVAERRLRLSASSFGRAVGQNLFWFSLIMIAVGVWQRRRLARWLEDAPLARAGMTGAFGAVVLGVVANDSGATFLIIGTIGMLGIVAFAYSRYASVP
jgi:hypothetical protein